MLENKEQITQAEFNKLFEQLTPENKKKLVAKYNELLAEQEAQK